MLGAAHVDDVVDDAQLDKNGSNVDDFHANDNDHGDESDEREKEAHMQ